MLTKVFSFFLFSIALFNIGHTQNLEAHYSFDACSFKDVEMNYEDGNVIGLNCECGVKGDALSFTGNETMLFNDLDMALRSDFTMSFYFFPDAGLNIMDIISITNDECKVDSTLKIVFSPTQNKVKIDIQEFGSKRVNLEGSIDNNKCWHHVVLVNVDNQYDLYVDEKRVDNSTAATRIHLKPDARFKISGNPCVSSNFDSFRGLIDELYIWDYALTQEEINATYFYPDKIISPDKTVLLGDQYQIITGGTCANFNWSPNLEIQNIGEIDPLIIPTQTQDYILSINHPNCKIRDTINVYVLDPEELDCNSILLPKAFTPNNDGLNETYGISNGFIIEEFNSLDIYDRWANIVFHTNDKEEKWDGSMNGEKMNPGLYVYKVSYNCKGKTYNKTDSFSLLR